MIKHLVIGPAGMGLFVIIGYLKANYRKFENIDTITGSSAGAVIGLFLAMGWHPDRIMDAILSVDIHTLSKTSIRSLLMNYGLIKTDKARKAVEKICGRDPTFSDIKFTFYVAAYSLTMGKMVYFSKFTHPDMSVIDAVIMSCTIPFIVAPVPYRNEIYVDGGSTELWPSETVVGENPDECFLIIVKYPNCVELKTTSIISFIKNMVSRLGWDNRTYVEPQCKWVNIDCSSYNVLDFSMEYETKLKMIMYGTTIF
jgi:NTE family protein